jgi:hypothetical protein
MAWWSNHFDRRSGFDVSDVEVPPPPSVEPSSATAAPAPATAAAETAAATTPALIHAKNWFAMPAPIPTAANDNPGAITGGTVHTNRLERQAAMASFEDSAIHADSTGLHVGSNVKKPLPRATNVCSGFRMNGFVSELGSATAVA